MKSVQEIAREIVAREGGYVNDPDDPGGATNFGVTIHTMRRLKLDLNGDGRVDTVDVKKLTRADAEQIFLKHYFFAPRIDKLPSDKLRTSVFDMQVNAGSNAVKILQRTVRKFGTKTTVDGVIGPQTIRACQQVYKKSGDLLYEAYGIERRNYYYRLADLRPKSRKYARRRDGGKGGWITRAEEFMSPKYRLTNAQHAKRISSWA